MTWRGGRVNVLITATGTGVGQSVIKGLKFAYPPMPVRPTEYEYRLVGVDVSSWAAGLYRCHKGYLMPMADDVDYVTRLVEVIKEENIHVVIPCCDPELPVLSRARKKIERETEALVVIGSEEVVRICRDKYETARFLEVKGLPHPRTALPEDAKRLIDKAGFPILVKPRGGSGSSGVSVVFTEEELWRAIKPDVVLQEYLIPTEWDLKEVSRSDIYISGLLRQVDEYSTEVIISKKGNLLGSVTNWRTMKKGVPSRAIVKDYPDVREAAEAVADILAEKGLVGPVNLQCRRTVEGPKFFEINPRFSGSTAVRCVAGFNGPDTVVKDFIMGYDESDLIEGLGYSELVEMRYHNEMYITPDEFEILRHEKETKMKGLIYRYF